MAAADATRQAIWLGRLLDDLKLGLGADPLPILKDNMGTFAIAKESSSSRAYQAHRDATSLHPGED